MPNRFRIAFSFAGEKRDFVEKTANILAETFGKSAILYDRFHEAEFARIDTGIRLPILYGEHSDLIVPVLCSSYDEKRWTGWEWNHIYGLLTPADRHRVMPSRFEYATVSGISPTAGFIELDQKTPDQFAQLILERLAINEGLDRDFYKNVRQALTNGPLTSIPHNLPSLQPFFGRENELRKIADALDPESRTWGALIDGPGGMGKSSLAIKAAYAAPPKMFDKIVFISLKSRELDDDGVRDLSGFLISGLAELFNELARELDRLDITKSPEAERPRALLDALRGNRVLLILDNLESLTKQQSGVVITFVKKLPNGCKAILTSRQRIGSAAEELILQELSEQAALDTLALLSKNNLTLANASTEDRLRLYQATNGHPLLLRWTAGQIGRRSCLTISDAVSYLRSCQEDDPLEFIFGDLVEDLSENEVSVLCTLSYFTIPAKIEHIVAITSLTVAVADQSLRSLVNRSLVVPTEELKTFTIVALVADFIKKRMPEVVMIVGEKLQTIAYNLVTTIEGSDREKNDSIEPVWPIVSAALPGIIAGSNTRLQKVCDELRAFLEFTGRWDEWLALERDAESQAILCNDFLSAGRRAHRAGWVYRLRGESHKVIEYADRAHAHWSNGDANIREIAFAIRLRGIGYFLAKDYKTAVEVLDQAIRLSSSVAPDSIDVGNGLNTKAAIEMESGDLDSAERDFNAALLIAETHNDFESIAVYRSNLADLALVCNKWAEAETLARGALVIAETIGRLELIAYGSHHIARALLEQDRKPEAIDYAERAVKIFTQLGALSLEEARATLVKCQT